MDALRRLFGGGGQAARAAEADDAKAAAAGPPAAAEQPAQGVHQRPTGFGTWPRTKVSVSSQAFAESSAYSADFRSKKLWGASS
jgi:hypothetical protein